MYDLKRYLRIAKHLLDAVANIQRIPAPYYHKHALLLDFFPKHASVIETGTYLGETTSVLAHHCKQVLTLEPYLPLYNYNLRRFRNTENVTVINASSEEGFEEALSGLRGPVAFWLDGHFSGEGTHGELSTASPVEHELRVIEDYLNRKLGSVYVAIDDARLFTGIDGYPSETLVKSFAEKFDLSFFKFRDIYFLQSRGSETVPVDGVME